MNGREEWAKFAEENKLTWEEGPRRRCDQYGNVYDTYFWPVCDDEQLKKYINPDTHVVVRIFPQSRDGMCRMRFSSYPKRPGAV